jgi:hypothetical protein
MRRTVRIRCIGGGPRFTVDDDVIGERRHDYRLTVCAG